MRTRVWLGAGACLAAAISASPALTQGRPEPWDRGWNATNHPADQRMPAISGNGVVWWDARFGPGFSAIFWLPAVSGDLVAREDRRTGDAEAFVHDLRGYSGP